MANQILLKRASGSDPTASDLALGEIAIRTDNGKLFTKKDNGTVAEISGAGGSGNNFFINTLSSSSGSGGGSATFNGTATRFELSNPPNLAAQLLVSIDGVIQKPNTGTSPSEGFAIDGNDIIFSSAPASGADFFIVTYASLAIAEPSDNTVTSAKIVDGAIVNADINANAAIDGSKINADFGSQNLVIADKIIHSGDTNTAIRFASNDQFSVETAGSTRFSISGSQIQHSLNTQIAGTLTMAHTNGNFIVNNNAGTNVFTVNSSSGNVTTTGTVDGRDVAADGSKLDGIELGATADQTASDIKTLLNSSGLVNAQIDASAAIAGTKISPDFGSQNIVTTGSITTTDDVIINGSTNDESTLRFKDAGSESWMIRQTNNDNVISFRRNSVNYLSLQANGNIDVANGIDVTGNITVTGTVDGVDIATRNTLFGGLTSSSGVLTNGVTATTQSASDNSTKVATTAYADTAVANLVDSAPGTLNTLNELAAALGDDPNFATTVTNSIATKLPLAGGTLTGNLIFGDSVEARFGAGADLKIYHDGSHSRLVDSGTGFLVVQSSRFQINNAANTENMAAFIENGAVELYHDNSKKFETTAGGSKVTGNFIVNSGHISIDVDNKKLLLGASDDLQIYHDGTHSNIDNATNELRIESLNQIRLNTDDFRVYKGNLTEFLIRAVGDGSVELYHNGSKKFETVSGGAKVTGTLETTDTISTVGNLDMSDSTSTGNNRIRLGSGDDLEIYHDGSNSFISDAGTGGLKILGSAVYIKNVNDHDMVEALSGGAVSLFHNNNKKFETTSGGVYITGAAVFPDGSSNGIQIGNSSDLQIYHSGTQSYVTDQGTGNLNLQGTSKVVIGNAAHNENMAQFFADGQVELYHNNSKKFETKSFGALVSGNVDATGNFVIPNDTGKFLAGASNDLQIYHDGTDSYLQNNTGTLRINNDGSDLVISTDNNIHIRTNGTEEAVKAIANGAVELYFNNSGPKLATTANGVNLGGGTCTFNDNGKLSLGTGGDLQIYHTGTESFIDDVGTGRLRIRGNDAVHIRSQAENEEMAVFNRNGSVDLYHNNNKKFETTANGVDVQGNITLASSNNAPKITFDENGANDPKAEIQMDQLSGSSGNLLVRVESSGNLFTHTTFHSNSALFCPGVFNSTTGSGSNQVSVDSSGKLRRITSSQRYKTNIETLEDKYADAILEARPVWYKSLCEDDNKDHGHWGFVAEEIEKIDPRLCSYKTSETVIEDGKTIEKKLDTPIIESVQYERFIPHLINLVKRQDTKIKVLESDVAKLLASKGE